MYNKKESAVSPVVAVVLLLGIVGVIVGMAGAAVFGNIDNILINDVKKVDVAVQISVTNTDTGSGGTELESKVIITPLSGKDLEFLEYYDVYLLGENVENEYTSVGPVKLDIPKGYNPEITRIVIIGHFTDGGDAVIFTGKIDDGYVISTGGTAKGTATPIGPGGVVTGTPKPAVYDVFYNLNGGSSDQFTTHEVYNSETSGYEYSVKLPEKGTLTKEGFSFNGWREISNPDKLYTYSDNIFTITDKTPEDIRFDADWVLGYMITFMKNGAELDKKRTVDLKVDPPEINIADGYCLYSWYEDPELTKKWDMNAQVTKDMTLYAHEYYPYFKYGETPDKTDSELNPNNGENSYEELEDLINGINYWKPGTIRIDEGSGNTMTVTILKDIPLEVQAITIKNGWSLTIKTAETISTTGKVNGDDVYPASTKPHIWASPKEVSGNLININGGTLNVGSKLVIDGCGRMKDSVIKVESSSTLNVNGVSSLEIRNGYGDISKPYTKSGGGIYSEGTITTTGTGIISITNCKSYYRGGGIFVNKGTVNIKCNINECYSTFGGGFCAYQVDGVDVTIKDGSSFTNNHADQYIVSADDDDYYKGTNDYYFGAQGGGIYMNSVNSFILGDSSSGDQIIISGNTADSCGGGIHTAWNSPVINGDVLVKNNKAFCDKGSGSDLRYGGGGIYNEGSLITVNGLLTVQECESSGNSDSAVEEGNGGGIYNTGTMNVNFGGSLTVSDNTATDGGGIYNTGTLTVTSDTSDSKTKATLTVSDNTATGSGGGIYNTGTFINLGNPGRSSPIAYADTIIISNRADKFGGGIYNSGTGVIKNELVGSSYPYTYIPRIEISRNEVPKDNRCDGNAIYNDYGSITSWKKKLYPYTIKDGIYGSDNHYRNNVVHFNNCNIP